MRLSSLSRHGDLVLAAAVLAIVGAMILPMPPWLLDVLLSTNITVAVILLLVGIYMDRPVSFSSFPSLLLITTLFRLALNVSSTRMILSQAYAGEVIQAFGRFVVSGDYVVGAVVFLILTIVQFVVIAKGSERVAEVAARFALDGMPGKQMSIDADLRAGLIDGEGARARRRELERESQLYGAMDGAMKFVKGDAVAGLMITAVNILAGTLIGTTQRSMSVDQALRTYGLLTIGDGLVSQIPALIIATSAGMVVTRVAGEEAGSPLSKELARQVLSNHRVLGIASGMLFLIGLVPGMPTGPFFVLALACGFAAFAMSRKETLQETLKAEHRTIPIPPSELAVRAGTAEGPELDSLDAGIRRAVASLSDDLGIPLPVPVVSASSSVDGGSYKVYLRGVPLGGGRISGKIDETVQEVRELAAAHVREMIGVQEARMVLDAARSTNPALVEAVQRIDLSVLAGVLRLLVSEGISLADTKGLLDALASSPEGEHKDPSALAERVRVGLARRITWMVAGEQRELDAILLSPEVEEEIRSSIRSTSFGAFLALGPDLGREILDEIASQVDAAREQGLKPALLVAPDTRRFVRSLVEQSLPDLPVVTYGELLPDTKLKPVATIGPPRA